MCVLWGGITLIKSVLSSLPLYYMSFYRMPKRVINLCNKIMRSFLWGFEEGDRGISWISWESICKPKELGGLGLRYWEAFNKALLGKWRWRLLERKDSLWEKIIRCKYLVPSHGNNVETSGKLSCWWKDLLITCYAEPESCWFDKGLTKRLGNGNNTRF